MSKERILDEKVEVDYQDISNFFNERGKNKKLENKYNYVLFQDDCPELAVQRDQQEKEKIGGNILEIKENQRILDIGCGIGRWGEYLLEKKCYYVGIDASPRMIEMAEENLKQYSDKKLIVGTFQQLVQKLEEEGETGTFDKVFVNGVFMYLNESDFQKALKDIHLLCSEHCEIYVKESMGIESRLTLRQIYSESLSQDYSAIYRSIDEYGESLKEEFGSDFSLVSKGRLFDEELANRKETVDYYYVLRC